MFTLFRTVIVDQDGAPLIDVITKRVLVNAAISYTAFTTTEDSPGDPPTPPTEGGPWYLLNTYVAGAPMNETIYRDWGSLT
jgi:hypothetical protein